MKMRKRKIVLVLDNATSHSHSLTLSNVNLQFLPPNTTSKLQPLDLGIIRAFKARYRKHMLKHLLTKIDSCENGTSLTKSISVLDAIYWIMKSWNETKDITIQKCFQDAGFPSVNPEQPTNQDGDDPDDDIPLAHLSRLIQGQDQSELNFEKLDEVEESLPTEEIYEGDWECSLIEQFKSNDESETTCSDTKDELSDTEPENNDDGADMSYDDVL